MKDIDKKNVIIAMTEDELDEVTGGNITWTYRPERMVLFDGTYVDGYRMEGENLETGTELHTRFIEANSFEKFKKLHGEDDFYVGALHGE